MMNREEREKKALSPLADDSASRFLLSRPPPTTTLSPPSSLLLFHTTPSCSFCCVPARGPFVLPLRPFEAQPF